ncbi:MULTISPECIES: L-threonylcarbamoyladenylate synthase [Micromonospora]|uniref:L-threonylcarbamoyladenylate synthase n=1 Tax=Micromonospora rifamycinica TaxID=291594 RepID=A0A109IG14_9ACTN|nr:MULTISPECIES: L-threonylcarbamoyladenylate synthase [Micromonospora]KWV29866.1 translation factor SUA5 [Micromonospora rifamycinica]WFE67336.1 L-threonylcarbamoyladenylate synthase [Micromonospora sp. WMMD714]SCG79967.1 translation factor SUA5 [Micromonospora rifamycinica]
MLYDCRSPADRDRGVAAAIEAVKNGELVVLPTDTVYGIGADAFTPYAVRALSDARGGSQQAPPVLIGSRHTLDGLVFSLPKAARDLVEAFWPGALTIVVEHSPSLAWDLGDASGTVAVRMPLHPVALEVLRETGPMAVAAANKVGQPAAVTAEEARDQLSYSVRVYLEAGACPDPVPSTIVDLTGETPRLLRAGAIDLDQLREVAPDVLDERSA